MATLSQKIAYASSDTAYNNLLSSNVGGIYFAKTYMKLDGTTDDYTALYNLINTTINGDDAEIWFKDGTALIGTSITIPSNVKLVFLEGGILKPSSGVVVTGSGAKIEAGVTQIFDISVSGITGFTGTWYTPMAYPQWFGALGDASTDDTDAFNATANNFKTITVPNTGSNYMIDAEVDGSNYGWTIPSNRIVYFEQGASLKAITNDADNYRVIYLNGVSDVKIYNPTLYGEKDEHTGVTGEGGHALGIYSSTDIYVENPICEDCWGVGIALVYASDIYILNAQVDNARQNGIAIIAGRNITLKNPKIINTDGTAPQAGIDIEPNLNTDYLEHINIINPYTKDNSGAGIVVALANLEGASNDVSIKIEGHTDDASLYGFYVGRLPYNATGILKGTVKYLNGIVQNNGGPGIYINNYAALNTPTLLLDKPTVLNPNDDSYATSGDGNGISIFRATASTDTYAIGNISILNPTVKDLRATEKMVYGIFLSDEKSVYYSNINIIDPIDITGFATDDINYHVAVDGGGLNFTDRNKIISDTFSSDRILASRVYTELTSITAAGVVNFTLPTAGIVIGAPITFIVNNTGGLRITPAATHNILPDSATVGKYMQSTDLGASITIRKFSATSWIIEKSTGTWSVEP